jgi:hypothetical protein
MFLGKNPKRSAEMAIEDLIVQECQKTCKLVDTPKAWVSLTLLINKQLSTKRIYEK